MGKNNLIFLICPVCQKQFRSCLGQIAQGRKYCSWACFLSTRKREGINKCMVCDKEFKTIPQYRAKKTCSKECCLVWTKRPENIARKGINISNARKGNPVYARRNRVTKKCYVCKIPVERKKSSFRRGKITFCSIKCNSKFLGSQRGEQCGHWKGGKDSFKRLIRFMPEYINWRKSVFERDQYRCQECFQLGGILHSHHKNPFSFLIQEFLQTYSQFSPIEDKETLIRLAVNYQPFWNIDNGITLCKFCHSKTNKLKSENNAIC